ncbi:hypothetical protein RvY_06270-4 [Ramazzottius varieornatus]|nr:hypothetical protein RvY_06270-4 [Ramazzottius varieornatus]
MVFWWLFSLCTVATYSGNLIAFLTFPGKPSTVNNLHAFLYERNMDPIIEKNSYSDQALGNSRMPDFLEAWRRIQNNDALRVDTFDEILRMISSSSTVGHIGGTAAMQSAIAQDSVGATACRYTMMRQPMEKVNYAWAFPKGTNYPPLFDKW